MYLVTNRFLISAQELRRSCIRFSGEQSAEAATGFASSSHRLVNCDRSFRLITVPHSQLPRLKQMRFAVVVLGMCILILGVTALGKEPKKNAAHVAESIRLRLEAELFTLNPDIQGHFALRMYRLTGDERYLPPIVYDLLVTLENVRRDLAQSHDSAYLERRCSSMRNDLNPKTRKGQIRAEMFGRAGAIQFRLNLLHAANDMAELGVADVEPYRELFQGLLGECRPAEIESFLLDTSVVRAYAPQAVNYVYYLYDLGLADIRPAYTEAFQKVYPDSADDELTADEFTDKVYGLTHFITAASRYYQRPVDSDEFSWVLDYFHKNLDRILEETREDVVSEVGLCFLLAGRENDPAVAICRQRIIDRFDSDEGLIPSTTGRTDLAQSEHRNIIAYMLLAWPDQLITGPNLPQTAFFQDVLGTFNSDEE